MTDMIKWYDAHAEQVAREYEAVPAEEIHGWLSDLLPTTPGAILDIGAGSGRDAAWFSKMGHDVTAVEPSSSMRRQAQTYHPELPVHWNDDQLPTLKKTSKSGLHFDLILLNAVWMHVSPGDRERAFRKLVTLVRPGGVMAFTLREGPDRNKRGFHHVSASEIEDLARSHGAFVIKKSPVDDRLGRSEVRWIQIAVRLPDDGTGALPILRHVILNDDKSSTYKLGLLRTLCRIASSAPGMVNEQDGGNHVEVPLGLVGLTWLQLYKPLLDADLPQNPSNRGYKKLGFARPALRALKPVSQQEFRVGIRNNPETAELLHRAIRDACNTIVRMPANYMTYSDGQPILPVVPTQRYKCPANTFISEDYLAGFGKMLVPTHLWHALRRYDCWIEPALQTEWVRLIRRYANRQERTVSEELISRAMSWVDIEQNIAFARERANEMQISRKLFCVWTGRRLAGNFDVDHCLPRSVWPCNDLWNLMPAHRQTNQHQKRDLLPSGQLLRVAQDRIMDWWLAGYRLQDTAAIAERFRLEAAASLTGVSANSSELDDVFIGVNVQRMRLRHNQQVPEWDPDTYL